MRRPTLPTTEILTHESLWLVPYPQWVRSIAAKASMHAPAQNGVTRGDNVLAYINHGKWIAECPAEGCNAAQVSSENYREFWCLTCGNADIDFAWRHVQFPRDRSEIEAALMQRSATRPDGAIRRNWVQGESVEDLLRENVEHGVGL